jgi:hypothetical protein
MKRLIFAGAVFSLIIYLGLGWKLNLLLIIALILTLSIVEVFEKTRSAK